MWKVKKVLEKTTTSLPIFEHAQFRENTVEQSLVFLLSQCRGSKTLNKENMDAKLYIPFNETENGDFQKSISNGVDGA